VRVLIGNSAAKHRPNGEDEPLEGRRITTVNLPDLDNGWTLMEQVRAVVDHDGVWNNHSQGPNVADSTPDWVEADDPNFARLIASALGTTVGRPKNWVEEY
jgi:hypothetical protein